MIIFAISGREYRCPETWEEMTIASGIALYKVIESMPEKLRALYEFEGKRNEKDKRYKEIIDAISPDDTIKNFPSWYGDVIACLCGVDPEHIKYVLPGDRLSFYKTYCEKFVHGLMGMPVDYQIQNIESFHHNGQEYYLPLKKVGTFGETIPGGWMQTIEFTEAADLLVAADKLHKGKVELMPLLIAILCRKKNEKYNEDVVKKRADEFISLPLSVAWEVLFFSMNYTTTFVSNLDNYFKEEVSEL